uniref:Diacylglycerol kinase n=1 Tax=Periophthalmus magnuspinnatus TaxID=409849 RepID=A0A3B3ZUB9_9GOBI
HSRRLLPASASLLGGGRTLVAPGLASPAPALLLFRRGQQPSPSLRPRLQNPSSGHSFKKVTLTKPTFCHSCSEFIWGLAGYLCEGKSHYGLVGIGNSCFSPALVLVQSCFSPALFLLDGLKQVKTLCELHVHSDCAVFSCADCRCSHMDSPLQFPDTWPHHWREGCASSSCRCEVCRRSCGSSDVLTGLRCEWCGITSHGTCFVSVPPECTLGRFRTMILDPRYVQLESRNFSKMHLYRVQESSAPEQDGSTAAADSGTSHLFNVKFDPVRSPYSINMSSCVCAAGRQFLKVFDGDDAVKRGSSRTVSVSKATNNEEVVEAALRAYYLPDDPLDFELQEVNLHGNGHQGLHAEGGECGAQNDSSHSEEDILNRNGLNQNQEQPEDRGETWVLRAKPKYSEVLKVYQEWERSGLNPPQCTSQNGFSTIILSVLLNEVLGRLGRQVQKSLNTSHFVEGSIVLSTPDFNSINLISQVSLRQMHQTRLYVVENRRSEVNVELLIGGLPTVLDTKEYTHLLEEHLAIKSKGLHNTINQNIMYLLFDMSPLLVFVNPKSGGLKGRELLHGFRKILNPHQVFDISHGGPLPGLHVFRCVPRFRVLVCGGDGSVGWVLSVLETIRHKMVCREPPLAILPLGTGNDLSRVLRWGAGYSAEPPLSVLQSVEEAEEVLMDRWTILLDAQDLSQTGTDNGYLEPPKIVQMNNYFGLGIDAELSLDFHLAREDDPDKFTSRFHNKGVYVKVGLQKISYSRSLHKELQLQVDFETVPLPNIEGLIFLNIPSWGSGADLWGSETDGRFRKPSIDDGLLEVVGVTGVVHMGQVQSGLRCGIRIAQGNYIRLTVSKEVPVQVDGEPWVQPPGHIIISAAGPKVRMLRKSKQKQKKHASGGKDTPLSSKDVGY